MFELKKNTKYQKDIAYFQSCVNDIADPIKKKHYQKMIDEMKHHCTLIDEAHSDFNNGYIKPQAVRENVEQMITIRKTLKNLFKN